MTKYMTWIEGIRISCYDSPKMQIAKKEIVGMRFDIFLYQRKPQQPVEAKF